MILRRRVVKCEECGREVAVQYPDDIPARVVKEATVTEHRLRNPWCRNVNRPKLLWVSDEEVKE